jgi:DNA-binding YbaB/EbfC family protein
MPDRLHFSDDFNERTPMAGIPNLPGMMKQIQKMQEKMAQVQVELEGKTVSAEAGGGMVRVTANGKQRIVKIVIDREVVNPAETEMLEDLVLAAANKALDDAGKMAQDEVARATSGLLPNIPGLSLPGL